LAFITGSLPAFERRRLQEKKMRMAIFFRRSAERKPKPKTTTVPLPRNWTMRDWADLPPHHPRED